MMERTHRIAGLSRQWQAAGSLTKATWPTTQTITAGFFDLPTPAAVWRKGHVGVGYSPDAFLKDSCGRRMSWAGQSPEATGEQGEEDSWADLQDGKIAASFTTVDVLSNCGRQWRCVVPAQVAWSRR